MSIWNKILIGLILVSNLVLFYFAARTLKTHSEWRISAQKHEKAITAQEEEQQRLIGPNPADAEDPDALVPIDEMGLRQVKMELARVLHQRGRVWSEVVPGNVVDQDGAVMVSVTVDHPDPHQIAAKTVLYVFEEASVSEGGQYLGEFVVEAEAGPQLQLRPTRRLRPPAMKALKESRGPWIFHEIMPADEHRVFAWLADDDLRELMAGETEDEYLGEDRELRDYSLLMRHAEAKRTMLLVDHQALVVDNDLLDVTLAGAKKQEAFHQRNLVEANREQAELTHRKNAIEAHHQDLSMTVKQLRAANLQLLETNRKRAAEIERYQIELSRRINARTQAMAEASARGSK